MNRCARWLSGGGLAPGRSGRRGAGRGCAAFCTSLAMVTHCSAKVAQLVENVGQGSSSPKVDAHRKRNSSSFSASGGVGKIWKTGPSVIGLAGGCGGLVGLGGEGGSASVYCKNYFIT